MVRSFMLDLIHAYETYLMKVKQASANTVCSYMRDIRQFTDWLQLGDASLAQRHEMFLERKRAVEAQLAELQQTLELINYKCWYYETAIAAGTEKIHTQTHTVDSAPREPCENPAASGQAV